MTKTQQTLTLGAALALLLSAPMASAAFKCWTNNEGVRECGNTVPPEYAQQETRTISEQGITVDVNDRSKTKEELAAERQAAEAEKRRLEEEQKRQQEQDSYDRVLLGTFTSEGEIASSLKRKLSSLDAMIEVNHVVLEKLNEQLAEKLTKANNYDKKDKPVPAELQEEIDSLQRQVAGKSSFIAARKTEQDELRDEYAGYTKRFRELKGSSQP